MQRFERRAKRPAEPCNRGPSAKALDLCGATDCGRGRSGRELAEARGRLRDKGRGWETNGKQSGMIHVRKWTAEKDVELLRMPRMLLEFCHLPAQFSVLRAPVAQALGSRTPKQIRIPDISSKRQSFLNPATIIRRLEGCQKRTYCFAWPPERGRERFRSGECFLLCVCLASFSALRHPKTPSQEPADRLT